ncbi:hypothetical protein HY571_02230 [Candidatus Micrarchaeota archaeon]|nr:hypothetical protein [Candidatus Micrarchaeota archaeon]
MTQITLAGMVHGVYPFGGEVPRETANALSKALGLLQQFATHNPGSTIGIETISRKSIFQMARESFRGKFGQDSPLTPRIKRQVAAEIAHRYAANASAKREFESSLSRFGTFSNFRNAVLAGAFGVYEALHLRAEELGLKVEAIDDSQLRRRHVRVENDLLVLQSEERRTAGLWVRRAIGWLARQRDEAGATALSDRQIHMHGKITNSRLPLYFLGRVSAKAIHRTLPVASRVVEITG